MPNHRVNRTAGKRCLPVRFGLRPPPAGYAERSAWRLRMVMARGTGGSVEGKISAAFLDFASPLIDAAGPDAGNSELTPILTLAFTAWNAVVLDRVNGDTQFVDAIRLTTAGNPGSAALMELLLERKRLLFADDERLIGNYELLQEDGEWVLRAEARDPRRSSQ